MLNLEREVLLVSRTGSYNYNLATLESDEDYKVFVAPTFEDMYKNKMYANSIITDVVDHDIHDIRKIVDLLFKSNIAYLELLFSDTIQCHPNLARLFELRDDIARINLSQLFKSSGGMYLNRLKKLGKGTEGTQHLVDAHGYNTKEALHTFRTLNLPIRFANNGFKDFGDALKYNDTERRILLGIKDGDFTEAEFIDFVKTVHDKEFVPLKEEFLRHKPNEELKAEMDDIVMKAVKDSLFH